MDVSGNTLDKNNKVLQECALYHNYKTKSTRDNWIRAMVAVVV